MLNPIESTMTLYDAQLHASKELINAFLSGVQRIDRAVLQTAKEELNSQLAYAQALTVATDPRGAAVLRQSFETPNREHTLACYREIFDAMSEAMLASTRIFDQYVTELGRCTSGTIRDSKTAASDFAAGIPVADPFEFWNAGWRQWNTFTEQFRQAMTASIEQREPPDDDDSPVAPSTREKRQEARSKSH